MDELILYIDDDKEVQINADFKNDTFWATHQQIADLFEIDRSGITKHINRIIKDGEIDEKSNVQKMHIANSDRPVKFYNLDVILAVGYRVNSAKAVAFRKWATDILKQHLIQGYTVNRQRMQFLGKTLEILARSTDEMVQSVAELISQFTDGLDLLDNYDHNTFTKPKGEVGSSELTYELARQFIDTMKFGTDSELFGNERGDTFKGVLGSIYQTFAEQDLYPTLQEKAANLLYMVVKDHPFTDGNKRIAAGLFVYFLELNGALRTSAGMQIIDNNSLAAITLMIALSKPEEKEIMCLLVMNMLVADGEGGK
jgi:death-on-curing family protein